MKKRNMLVTFLMVLGLLSLTLGVTYTFFNYTRTGSANTINVGRIAFTSSQNNTISLQNVFPIATSEVAADTNNVGIVEVNIVGDTDYNEGIEYLISSVNTNITTESGKRIPLGIDLEVTNLGTESNTYFTTREAKNTTIYKKLVGGVLLGNQDLLVGYIKPNTTIGTTEGINGKITIKAYINDALIGVSDTYDGSESDNMGTTNEWANGRTILKTSEWNSMSSSGISFQIRIEANEGIWVEESLDDIMRTRAIIDNIASVNVANVTGIDWNNISGDSDDDGIVDNGLGIYILSETAQNAYPILYYRGPVEDNNVYFAGKCWQIMRTTDTGGIKMIYNGENTGTTASPACEPVAGTDRQITLNIDGVDNNAFPFSGRGMTDSLAYGGYTYKTPIYTVSNAVYESGSKFGNGVIWDGTNYTITDVSNSLNTTHHYTCGTAGTTTCSSIRYYVSYFLTGGVNYHYYYTLTNGKTIEDVVSESLSAGTIDSKADSNAKVMVERWYEENIYNTGYDDKVEDTVYCNDRRILQLGGFDPNGGTLSTAATTVFKYVLSSGKVPSLMCLRHDDAYTKNSGIGNGLLKYSVGLIEKNEIYMSGWSGGYLGTGENYWTMLPNKFEIGRSSNTVIVTSGGTNITNTGNYTVGLRPVLSLKQGVVVASGDGTATNPYIIGN